MSKLKFLALIICLSASSMAAEKKTRQVRHDGEHPCKDASESLEVLDPKFQNTLSAAHKKVKYPVDRLTVEEAEKICRAIDRGSNIDSIEILIESFANKRKVTTAHIINKIFARQECDSRKPDNNTIMTYAMYTEVDNFKAMTMNGFDPSKPIRDFDGELKDPLVMATDHRNNAKDKEGKKRWQRVRGAIKQAIARNE